MRIDAGHSHLTGNQPSRPAAVTQDGSVAFPAMMAAATQDAAQAPMPGDAAPDFTSMTRKDMFDWMNGQILSGDMSLDDSRAFLGMTVKIPVGAGQDMSIALDDRERVNFVQKGRDGIAGARARHDQPALRMLETAMRIMQSSQGLGIDRPA